MSNSDSNAQTALPAKKFPQYIAAVTACLGALAFGAVHGWTGNISEDMKRLSYNGIHIDDSILGWIGSLAIFGATFSCIPIGYLCNLLGRKKAMMYLTIPFVIGWLFIIFANYLWMIYLGRFLTGMAGGAFCVAAPIYISENSEKDIRGALASYFDLLLTSGIFIANGLAMILDTKLYTIILGTFPLLFALIFAFQPESYVHYISQNKYNEARKSLICLRGKSFDVDEELESTKLIIKENEQNKVGFLKSIKTKAAKKATLVSCAMMVFQQASGVEAIVLYTSSIFESTGVDVDPKISTLIFAALQALLTFVSSLIVDKLGRRIILILSSFGTAIAVGVLGAFFTLESHKLVDEDTLSTFKLVPLISLCVYTIAYSFGLGSIPWFLSAELFPPEINSFGCAFAAMINLFTAFLISKFYFDMRSSLGSDVTFYFYAVMSLLCVVFVYYFLPETKNKTLAEIQRELNK